MLDEERLYPGKNPGGEYTNKTLHLDLKSAHAGKTWLLLPQGYRDRECGQTYPLPSRRSQLQLVACIAIPHDRSKKDSGCQYIRRCMEKFKNQQREVQSALLDVGKRRDQVIDRQKAFKRQLRGMRKDVRVASKDAIEEIRIEATKQIASLKDLFSMGREIVEKQMKAYLADEEVNGEKVTNDGARSCFRIVAQTVKALGLPSDQKKPASDAIVEEMAEAIKSTRETIELAPSATKTDETLN